MGPRFGYHLHWSNHGSRCHHFYSPLILPPSVVIPLPFLVLHVLQFLLYYHHGQDWRLYATAHATSTANMVAAIAPQLLLLLRVILRTITSTYYSCTITLLPLLLLLLLLQLLLLRGAYWFDGSVLLASRWFCSGFGLIYNLLWGGGAAPVIRVHATTAFTFFLRRSKMLTSMLPLHRIFASRISKMSTSMWLLHPFFLRMDKMLTSMLPPHPFFLHPDKQDANIHVTHCIHFSFVEARC